MLRALAASFREKVWGRTDLKPWFASDGKRIGEVWFTDEKPLPILVKFLFTSDKLSVQVHPDDDYAREHEGCAGKTEMWHILHAEPGARIALGFREPITRERLREASLSGEVEKLLNWVTVQAGDTYFTPAGTVHAIGEGIVLCEIQQNSDVTYRLYDYGRPRELQVERAVEVADLGRHPGACQPATSANGDQVLSMCRHFATEALALHGPREFAPGNRSFDLLIVLEGSGHMGEAEFHAGQVWLVPADAAPFRIVPHSSARLLRTYVP
ncbi:MAG: class I mannose-6-phosphate isomerase [Bryobacteraceae bacterium]